MKKIITILIITSFLIWLIPAKIFATNDTYFIVTAYYSPLPGQNFYLKGNYEDEKKLNGEWIRWASWKEVFSWMLAAPKNYSFWTKIYLEWLGIWEVADRGGAIVNAWKRGYEYDRIDIWMWYGDEWLKRALYWWKRKVKWTFLSSDSKVNLDYTKIPSPNWATSSLKSIPSIFNTWIWVWTNKDLVIKLQEFLNKIWLYNSESNGIYNTKIIDIIYNFQIENDLIESSISNWAWYWGTKTRNLMLKKYLNWEFDENTETNETEEIAINTEESDDFSIFNQAIKESEDIKKLQNILNKLEIYNWEKTWEYNDIVDAIADYQLENNIIKSLWDAWTGYFGPKTRASLKDDFKTYLEKEVEKEKIKQEEEKRRLELEQKFKELEKLSQKEAEEKISYIGSPKMWDVSSNVRELQNTLKTLWYFDYKDTAIFWEVTKSSLISYQLDKGLIKSEAELWAWIFWPKTKESLRNDLANIILEEKINKNEELAELKNNENKEISFDLENNKL